MADRADRYPGKQGQRGTGKQTSDTSVYSAPVSVPTWIPVSIVTSLVLPLAITLLGFGLRVALLDRQSLWSDEYITLVRAGLPLGELMDQLPIEHTPLYFVLLHFWFFIAGSMDFVLRFPSAVWGAMTLPLLFALGRRVFGLGVALVGALLFAVNPFQVWYSQDARMYPQLAALSIAALLLLDMGLAGDGGAGEQGSREAGRNRVYRFPWVRISLPWLGYVIALTLVLYTHYYAVLTVAITGLYAIGRLWTAPGHGERRAWRAFVLSEVAVALLFLPWLPRALRLLDFPGWREPVTATLAQFVGIYTFGTTLPANVALWLSVAAGGLYLVGLFDLVRGATMDDGPWTMDGGRRSAVSGQPWAVDGRETDTGSRLTFHVSRFTFYPSPALVLSLVCLAVPALVIIALLLRKPDFHPRYFIAATPVFSLVLAQGVLVLGRRVPVLSVVALAFLLIGSAYSLNLWYTDTAYAKAYYKDYMAYILSEAGSKDALLLQGPSQFLAKRYGSDNLDHAVNLQGSRWRDRPQAEVEQMIADLAQENSPIWLAVELPQTPGYVKTWLDLHGYQLQTHAVGEIGVWAYLFPPALPAPIPAAQVTGPAPVEVGWTAAPNPAHAGATLPLEIDWLPTAPVQPDLKVSLRLIAPDGSQIWQRDRTPVDGVRPSESWRVGETIADRFALRLAPDLSPGDYTLRVILYDGATLAEQRAATLGVVRVER